MGDGYPDVVPLIWESYQAMSMNYAMAHGAANIYTSPAHRGTGIDLNTDSPGKQAIDAMINRSIEKINLSPTLSALLAKPQWEMRDREIWENAIAKIARDEVFDEPRFGTYRLDHAKPQELSITEVTPDTNFHCEPMATINGILMQKMENHFLQGSTDAVTLKRQTDYYITGGVAITPPHISGQSVEAATAQLLSGELLHAYIVSPVTANYIEGTQSRERGWNGIATSPYHDNQIAGYSFKDFLAGYPLQSENHGLSLGYNGSEDSLALAKERRELIAAGRYAELTHVVSPAEFNAVREENFINERTTLMTINTAVNGTINQESMDAMDFADQLTSGGAKGEGRSYAQLAKNSSAIDFAMSDIELTRAIQGNRIFLWAQNSPYQTAMLRQGLSNNIGAHDWTEEQLNAFLTQHGVSDTWIQRPIAPDVRLTANNFEARVKEAYDTIPPQMLTLKGNNGEFRISFDDYLSICREEYTALGGRPEEINAPGTMVPVIHNPARAWAEWKARAGRPEGEYEKDPASNGSYHTSVVITGKPGIDHSTLKLCGVAILNGMDTEVCFESPVKLSAPVKPLPLPVTPGTSPNPQERSGG